MIVLGQALGQGVPPAQSPNAPERLQFKRNDGTAMVQIGPGLLVVNHLRPYPIWPVFRALVVSNYERHREIAGELGLERIGVRYINHIPLAELSLPKDVPVVAPVAEIFEMERKVFFQKFDLDDTEKQATLVHQCGTISSQEGLSLAIDLDFFSTKVQGIETTQEIMVWLERAHDVIERAFVRSLSEEFYERLRTGGEP